MADGTAATVAGGRRRGECFAGSGEPASCDHALAPGPVWVELPAASAPALSNFRSSRSPVRIPWPKYGFFFEGVAQIWLKRL